MAEDARVQAHRCGFLALAGAMSGVVAAALLGAAASDAPDHSPGRGSESVRGRTPPRAPSAPAPPPSPEESSPPSLGTFTLRSSAFAHTDRIPDRYTVEGEDLSPPLEWRNPPHGTATFAIICEDLDTRRPFVHWVIYGIPASVTRLPEGLPRERELTEPVVARQGTSSFPRDNTGYRGPATPRGDRPHRYQFTIYALKAGRDHPPGLVASALRQRMKDEILGEATLIGTYSRARKPGETPPGVQERETLPPGGPP